MVSGPVLGNFSVLGQSEADARSRRDVRVIERA